MKKRNFSVIKHDEVNHDLQKIVDYYNNKKHKLGNTFYSIALKQMKRLNNDFLLYEVKYQNVRCVALEVFHTKYITLLMKNRRLFSLMQL